MENDYNDELKAQYDIRQYVALQMGAAISNYHRSFNDNNLHTAALYLREVWKWVGPLVRKRKIKDQEETTTMVTALINKTSSPNMGLSTKNKYRGEMELLFDKILDYALEVGLYTQLTEYVKPGSVIARGR